MTTKKKNDKELDTTEKEVDDIQPKTWEEFVKTEMIAYLNRFMGDAKEGVIGIKYINPVLMQTEGGVEYDRSKASGVQIITEFAFEKPIIIPKVEA